MWREFWQSFAGVAIAFEWWQDLLSIPQSGDCLWAYWDFWEQLSDGWMCMYIYPYDDLYHPTLSDERKLRLGARR